MGFLIICKRPAPLDHHLQQACPSFWQPRKGHEKCIFETPHNDKKSTFSHLLTVRADGADWPPPLTVSLTVKCSFFYESPKCINAFEENDDYPLIEDQLQYPNAHHFPNSQLLQTPYFAFRCNIWSLKIWLERLPNCLQLIARNYQRIFIIYLIPLL